MTPVSIAALVKDAVAAQQRDLLHEGWALRYRVHRVDAKEDTVRDLVETADGNVARTLQRNGHPLTEEQQQAEIQRLQLLATTGLRRHASDTTEKFGNELIAAMPQAMNYTLVPGQPQLSQVPGTQVVLDFHSRDAFQPATTVQSLLKGLGGRVWIDRTTHHLLRIDVNVLQDVNVAFGLLARVYQGGTVTYEQMPIDADHDAARHIDVNVRLREFMVKTVPYHLIIDTSDQRLLPAVPSLQQGIAMLLAQ